jgi:S-sulfosulfanyl-L-cysteine sulfohydrolase
MTQHSRRKFLRNTALSGLALSIGSKSFALGDVAEENLPTLASQEERIGKAQLETPDDNQEAAKTSGTLSLLQTTDVHCQIHPHDELFWENDRAVFRKCAGYAHLATYFKQVRKKNPHTFLIDTGDMFQGSALSVKTTGRAMSPILNALGYDLYTPGNWEVVYYKKEMQRLLGGLHAPKVCANMFHDAGDGKTGALIFPAYYTWSQLDVKIGFLGYTDPLVPLRQSPNYSKGIIYTKPEENLKQYVGILREQEQCDLVIILSHLGLSQQIALANHPDCEGVDYIFGGDTHERVRTPIVCKYAKVVEPGAFGSFVGRLDLDVRDGKIVNHHYDLVEINTKTYKADKAMTAIIDQLEAPFVAQIEHIVGYSKVPLYRYFVVENTIDTLILDALDYKMDVDIVLSNGFRFCPPRSTPDHTGNIPITEAYLFDMLPVDATVRTGKTTGKVLRAWLEKELNNVFAKDANKRFGGWLIKFKGMQMGFNAFGEQGKRVQWVKVKGQPLQDDVVYTVSACERDGDPITTLCRITEVTDGQNMPYTLHEVLKEYLKANSPVNPVPQGNAVILDGPPTLLTQVTGVEYAFR